MSSHFSIYFGPQDDVAEEGDFDSINSTTDAAREDATAPHSKQTKTSTVACEFCQQKFDHKRLKDIHINACHRVGDCYVSSKILIVLICINNVSICINSDLGGN